MTRNFFYIIDIINKVIKMNVELHDYTNVPEECSPFLMEITVNGDRVCWVEDDFWVVDFYKLTPYEGMVTNYSLPVLKEQMNKAYDAYKSLSVEEFEIIKKAKEIRDRFIKYNDSNNELTEADIAFGM